MVVNLQSNPNPTLINKVVDLCKAKKTQLESPQSKIHRARYANYTKQMHELNNLTCRKCTEMNTQHHKIYQYAKSL